MTAAALTRAAPAGNWNGGPERDRMISAAHVILDNCGVAMSWTRVRRLVQTFEHRVQHNGFAFFDFLANSVCLSADERRRALADPDIARVIAYADPTGETAVNHVMRGSR